MRKYKKEFVCVKCGKKFTEEVPDCITPWWEEFLKEPKCILHRKFSLKNIKGEID